ncbi:MAG: asparagine synthase (glutamine-hydrolyzing) [Phycisphaerales bacterium]|nr:MAG: asparagine synthase (glutamine-hydrolyzing) [Phycisphaerales bacterium]
MLVDAGADENARLETMVRCLRHRGPDDSGHTRCVVRGKNDRAWLFGHRRLAVIDLSSAGHQPMVDPQTGNVIVFNGEIYNFGDLRQELEADGFEFQSRTDTEVALRGYARWGAGVVDRLRGMFALAIFDATTGRVMLARDRLGEKPLYYCRQPMIRSVRFAFASEVRALLAGNLAPRSIDRVGLQTYVTNGFVVGPHTLIEGVCLLEPGTALVIDVDGPHHSRRFWQIPLPAPNQDNGKEGAASLQECLADCVCRQLVSDAPLGAFLSGGIDSSVVVGLAQQHRSEPLRTFTLVFEEDTYSEARYARQMAQAYGTDHHEVMLTRSDFQRLLPEALGALDQPSFDGANTFFVSRAARQLGLTVALAGTGGDELFGGYASFSRLAKVRLLRRMTSLVPGGILRGLQRAALCVDGRRRGGYPSQTAVGKALSLLDGRGDLVHVYQVLSRIFLPDTVAALVDDYEERLSPDGLEAQLHSYLVDRIAGRNDLAALSFLELHSYLGNRLLRDTDAVSMAVSLEVRLPLVDFQLIEVASRLDERTRFWPIGSKRCLLEASGVRLPHDIMTREKSGFVLPIDVWLRDTLRSEASDVLLDPALCRRAGLRPEQVADLWAQFLRGDPGLYWTRIWAIFVLLRWCRRYGVAVQT